MGSWSGLVKDTPEEVYQKASAVILATGMSIVSTKAGKNIVAQLKGPIIPLPWPKAADKAIIDIAPSNGGSNVVITSSGSKGEAAMNQLVGVLAVKE